MLTENKHTVSTLLFIPLPLSASTYTALLKLAFFRGVAYVLTFVCAGSALHCVLHDWELGGLLIAVIG